MSLPNYLKPKKKYLLERIGNNNDGGYLVNSKSILKSRSLISFGIGNDWSFEKNFQKINSETKIYCYDNYICFTILLREFIKEIILFYKLNLKKIFNAFIKIIDFIFFFKKNKITKLYITSNSIENILQKNNVITPIFFKIDIEGSEYRILDDLIKIKKKIIAIVIEFHDIDLHRIIIKKFIKNIGLHLTHIHPNNFAILDKNKDPTVIELTFERFPEIIGKSAKLPNKKDQKCDPFKNDIILRFQSK
jgi:hypothetical protein